MALGKILSSSVRTNTQAGNPRRGRKFIEAKDANGNVVHRYGVDGDRDDVAWNKTERANLDRMKGATAWGRPMSTPTGANPPAATPGDTKVQVTATKTPAKGGLVNQMKGSARFGKSFTEVTRGGLTGHLYKDGTFVAMGKKKAPSARAVAARRAAGTSSGGGVPGNARRS